MTKKEEKKKLSFEEQIDQLKKQHEHHQIMMIKAQGAIDILMQNLELNNGTDDTKA